MSNLPPKPELRTSADPTVLRVIPELAKEIGTNESMILLQLAYWIKISPNSNYRDGRWWTYQSLRDMEEKAFSFLSYSTIRRALKDLEEAGYIIVADHYNEHRYDRTKWYALNLDRLQGLPCISVIVGNQEYKPTPETEGVSQNVTTIPETTTETTTEKTLSTHFGVLKFGDFQFDEDTEFILVNAQTETHEYGEGNAPVEDIPYSDATDEGEGTDSVEDAGGDTVLRWNFWNKSAGD
jgi:DNA-binding transcriptional ArsR family regulator